MFILFSIVFVAAYIEREINTTAHDDSHVEFVQPIKFCHDQRSNRISFIYVQDTDDRLGPSMDMIAVLLNWQ